MALLSQRKLGVNFLRFRLHDKYLKEDLSIVLDLVPSPSFSDILLREGTEQKRLTPESAAPGRVATAAPTRHVLAGAISDAKAEQMAITMFRRVLLLHIVRTFPAHAVG